MSYLYNINKKTPRWKYLPTCFAFANKLPNITDKIEEDAYKKIPKHNDNQNHITFIW